MIFATRMKVCVKEVMAKYGDAPACLLLCLPPIR